MLVHDGLADSDAHRAVKFLFRGNEGLDLLD
jgi:hypothetical protein